MRRRKTHSITQDGNVTGLLGLLRNDNGCQRSFLRSMWFVLYSYRSVSKYGVRSELAQFVTERFIIPRGQQVVITERAVLVAQTVYREMVGRFIECMWKWPWPD